MHIIDNTKTDFEKYATMHLGVKENLLNYTTTNSLTPDNSLTPYILEEREMRMTQMDIFSRLMHDRIIWVSGGIDANVSTIVQAQLLYFENVDKTKDSTMHIDSGGGSVLNGLGIVDIMDYVSFDIATINTGMCASMASVLLAAGTPGKRSSLRFSKVMVHQVSGGINGSDNIQDSRISFGQNEKYNFMLAKLLANYSKKTWKDIIKINSRDKWLTAEEAKEYGFIDEIVNNSKGDIKQVSELMEGFDDYMKLVQNV